MKKLTTITIHSLPRPGYNPIRFINEEIDIASFALFESSFKA